MKLEEGEIIQKAPYIYQTIDGAKHEVEGKYQILANNEVSFLLEDYDQTNTLAIDPEVMYSTFIGGTNVNSGDGDERAFAVTVDRDGNVNVAGQTNSRNFPVTSGVVQPIFAGGGSPLDIFVTKISLAPAEPPPPTTSSLSANSLNFTKQNIGTTSAPKSITVTNTGPNPLIISKIEITGDFAQTSSCTSGEIAPGRNCVINVVFTPTGTKKRLGTMTITDSTTSSPKTVSLKGKGK